MKDRDSANVEAGGSAGPDQDPPTIGSASGDLLIAGIGASAGGLEALQELFDALPADTGIAFVVVTHVPPDRVSLMPELLARHCSMPIVEVKGPTEVAPNHVYVAARHAPLRIDEGTLCPTEDAGAETRTQVIDAFFRSLAFDAGERAIGVILSGTGSDGTLGIKEIKGQAGMTMAQDEGSARFPSMPHSAIASTQIDFVSSPQEIARRLVQYARGVRRGSTLLTDHIAETAELFSRVFLLLRTRTGHDFSSYKSTTIRRRIARRMDVLQKDSVRDYLAHLQANPAEVNQLFKELLIGVTSFFRDPEAHEALARELPGLLEGKAEGQVLRVWIPGCSTGEEAYSLAIAIREAMERQRVSPGVQVFATDLDPEAIEIARTGRYPESIAADVGLQRLERFFNKEDGHYRIKKEIREMLVFAPQNVIEDPPFTKLDLLSCRNLLIYFDAKLQQRLIPLFHYALRGGGILFLGSSESVGSFGHLFEPIDKKWKIFRRNYAPASLPASDLPVSVGEVGAYPVAGPSPVSKEPELGMMQAAERALIQNLVPPAILIHERGQIVHIHGRTGQFLEPAPGLQNSANVYNMAREGLQLDLAVAIRHAAASNEAVLHRGARVKSNGHTISVDLRVKRLVQPEHLRGLFLVAFENATPVTDAIAPPTSGEVVGLEVAGRVAELERELQNAKEVHQSTIEELETANEELKSTNEELQSTNEELQSANEELETSKEEMQSLNEELHTVNSELQGKVEELSRANDDMKNLLNGTDIATMFLDNDLNIKRYTDRATKVIRLISTDVGRPVGDLVSKLKYKTFTEDAREVLRTLVFKESEVQTEDGAWYLMRILPYRTTENVIDGLVVTFVDITKGKGLQEDARRLVTTLLNGPVAVFGQTSALVYEWAFGKILGRDAEQVVGRDDAALFGDDAAEVIACKREALAQRRVIRRRLLLSIDGQRQPYVIHAQPALGPAGEVLGVNGVLIGLNDGAPAR